MPAIKPSSIRDLKDRINVFDVVSREVSLKRSGSNYKGLSPFNQEKTPSFYVSPDRGMYKCFSSGKAGDIITFVMEIERLSFVEAVETLAQRFNVTLEYEEGGRPPEDRSLRQELFELHEAAADYYHEKLLAKDDGGKWIRDYWTKNRRFELAVAEDFKIGFAPVVGTELGARVLKKGFSKEAIEASGLFYTRRGFTAEAMGYRFRGRLMIPIRDHQGRIAAFTARQLELTPQDDPSREAKYVNSPETPIFHKGNILFNLDRARMEVGPDAPFIMVEGQLDAIRCASVGLKGVVAPQGTGITDQQLRLIKRYEPRLICLLDGDSAGQKAALRMLPIALQQSVEVTFIPLKPGQDPDDIFRDGGAEAFGPLAETEIDCVTFAAQSVAPDPGSLTPQARAQAAVELFAIFEKAESAAAQLEFVRESAERLNLEPNAVIQDFRRFLSGQRAPRREAEVVEPKRPKAVYSLERDLLSICLHFEDIAREVAHIVTEDWLDTSTAEGELLNHVLNDFLHDVWNGFDSLNHDLENAEQQNLLANLRFEPPNHENPRRLANEALRQLSTKFADKKIKEIKLEIARKASHLDDEVLALLEKSSNLQKFKASPPKLSDTPN